MDEQVVPSFRPARGALKRCATVPSNLPALDTTDNTDSPNFGLNEEFVGKHRWQTPSRAGRQREKWHGARFLGLKHSVKPELATGVMETMREIVAHVVVAYVGTALPKQTVVKWLCLLCEYLELNADEVVLVVCLLRRYVRAGGKFIGKGDWARPQRWECVVAVACYLAVLLTEEFPGRTAMDLRELLGGNFRFGKEQMAFLTIVDWRISVSGEDFAEVKDVLQGVLQEVDGEKEKVWDWFKIKEAEMEREKKLADHHAAMNAALAASQAAMVQQPVVGKKRAFAEIAPTDGEAVVPRMVVPRVDGMQAVYAVPTAAFIPGMQAVPQWGFKPW